MWCTFCRSKGALREGKSLNTLYALYGEHFTAPKELCGQTKPMFPMFLCGAYFAKGKSLNALCALYGSHFTAPKELCGQANTMFPMFLCGAHFAAPKEPCGKANP